MLECSKGVMKKEDIKGDYVHIFNQGVDRRQIFLIREDYERFKAYLFILNDAENVRPANIIERDGGGDTYAYARGEPLVRITAFSLLPTHFHILAAPLVEKGIARFMQKVVTGYTMYFNARTLRTGRLFASGYKSTTISRANKNYARSYIHMTPMQFFLDSWMDAQQELGAHASKLATYPYASLQEFQTKTHIITTPEKSSVTVNGELRSWKQSRKIWSPPFGANV